ncbi:MAG: hypothetical protein V8S90_08690 [Lachnospiraceae bacterium]
MKKTWMNAEAEELSLEMTQNGLLPDDDFDNHGSSYQMASGGDLVTEVQVLTKDNCNYSE